jgi:phosphate-selective porin
MKKTASTNRVIGSLITLSISAFAATVQASELELYVDSKTKQIFSEPREGRVKLGVFKPVDAASTPPTTTADTAVVKQEILAEVDRKIQSSAKSAGSGFRLRGYVQGRYTVPVSGDKGINLWTDRSVGDSNSLGEPADNFLIRRGRLVFSGDVGERFSYYIQPDFASSAGTTGNVLQLRDAYGDISLDKEKVHRFRVGQSKVPYGFENLQSSQNRLALDRADAMNSAVRDERDTGVFYYYTPVDVQQMFSDISKAGLKHSGNYGMFAFGLYNGQGSNQRDTNDGLHAVSRFTYPLKTGSGQFYEFGIQGYSGKFVPRTGTFRNAANVNAMAGQGIANPTSDPRLRDGFDDQRVGISAIMYPQPFGLQAEWNWGKSPGLDTTTRMIDETNINGGYLQAMYMHKTAENGNLIPFVRWQYFDGANKAETNSPVNNVRDWEIGVEWQMNKEVELTAVYHMMDRNNLVTGNRAGREDYANFTSDALRLQVQYNF